MKFSEALNYSLKNISRRKLRSWLTIIGIIIGIITIVAIISISDGITDDIVSQLDAFGSNQMFIIPVNIDDASGFSSAGITTSGKLFERDADRVERIPGVISVTKINYGRASIEFKDKEIVTAVYGVEPEMFEQYAHYMKIEKGRIFKDNERRVVVLAADAATELFDKKKIDVGNYMYFDGEKYKVVGVLEKIGTSLSQTDDSAIYIPYEDGKNLFGNQLSKNEVSIIYVTIGEGENAEDIKYTIERAIAAYHKTTVDDKDFSVITVDFISEVVGGILGLLSTFLFIIAIIASVVGGIGISNTMFMSVAERTSEIGIMKSIGATGRDILQMFIIEAGIIGLIGGLIGLVLGVLVVEVIKGFGVPAIITPGLVVFAVLFSVGVGIVAGLIPAREAAKMDPIVALKKE